MSAAMKSMLAGMDCIMTRRPLVTKSDEVDGVIAEADRLLSPRRKARTIARALGKPELEERITEALHEHDDCDLGYIVRSA